MVVEGWWCIADCHLLSACTTAPCILPSVQPSRCPLPEHKRLVIPLLLWASSLQREGFFLDLRMNSSSDDSALKTPENEKPFDGSSLF